MVDIIVGSTNKALASKELKKYFHDRKDYEGYLYIGYPIIGTVEGAYPIDALWISPINGIVIFNLIEGKRKKDFENYEEYQDDCANKIEAKLKGYKQLVDKRRLGIDVNVITYAPFISECDSGEDEYPLCNSYNSLDDTILKFCWDDNGYYEKVISVLQAISTIRKGTKRRQVLKEESKGAKLKTLEDSIANLDNRQSKAVIETVEGVQRIRGLAGSGKTIVLALKAAYLHAQHPEWKIAITFNTRALKGQLKQLINTFYIEQTNEEPDWGNLQIMHAWGAPGGGEKNGIYYTFCSLNNIEYYDYMSAREEYGTTDPFGEVCKKALENAKENEEIYDAILIDEAQDFSSSFLRLCYEMLKTPKRLVYAYDELQNLRVQSLPAPEIIFGKYKDGSPRVKFYEPEDGKPQQDIILEKCYRNSRPALVTAHALGFGIYRKADNDTGSALVQMFDQNALWKDIGYEVKDGELEDGKHVVLARTPESSPEFLENHSEVNDLIEFKTFDTQEAQDIWVANQIKTNLNDDELRPDDIIVINPDPVTTKKMVGPIRKELFDMGINSHTAGVDTTPDVFFSENNDSVAFTGIYRAKGNEAAMVYVINSQSCYDSTYDLAKRRNQLFTAITRSKAWVRVLGVGTNMKKLVDEYNEVKDHQFTLNFTYPTKAEREKMNIVNRDMSGAEKSKIKARKSNIRDMINELENGEIYVEDLGEEQVEHLRKLLKIEE